MLQTDVPLYVTGQTNSGTLMQKATQQKSFTQT